MEGKGAARPSPRGLRTVRERGLSSMGVSRRVEEATAVSLPDFGDIPHPGAGSIHPSLEREASRPVTGSGRRLPQEVEQGNPRPLPGGQGQRQLQDWIRVSRGSQPRGSAPRGHLAMSRGTWSYHSYTGVLLASRRGRGMPPHTLQSTGQPQHRAWSRPRCGKHAG